MFINHTSCSHTLVYSIFGHIYCIYILTTIKHRKYNCFYFLRVLLHTNNRCRNVSMTLMKPLDSSGKEKRN